LATPQLKLTSPQASAARAVDASGNSLAIGDKVEVRYKGKGTKYYPGKISAVKEAAGVVTFSIAYDDGDKEDGALPANVRRVGGSSSDALSSLSLQLSLL